MSADNPKISIGLPVFNGQQFLDEAIQSILSQSYADFELLIADNCSTDDSLAIAKKWQSTDPRIKILESSRNLGAAPNFNRVFEAANGEYFRWAAGDDVMEPDLLLRSFELLDGNPQTVLVYSDAMDIDENGNELGLIYDTQAELRTDSPDPVIRFRDLILNDHSCISVFGLIRRSALAKTRLIDSFVGSDRVLLVQLAALGPFLRIDEPLLLHREHLGRSTRSIPRPEDRAAWFDTSLSQSKVYPNWRLLKEYGLSIARSNLSAKESAGCFFHLLRWIHWTKRTLWNDLK